MCKKDPYAQEMPLWLAQQRLRLKICELSIANDMEELAVTKQLNKLRQGRRKMIQQSIKTGEKELAEYLAEKTQ